jgi:hypothetical protein
LLASLLGARTVVALDEDHTVGAGNAVAERNTLLDAASGPLFYDRRRRIVRACAHDTE